MSLGQTGWYHAVVSREFAIRLVSLSSLCLIALFISACGKDVGASSATSTPTRKHITATSVPTTAPLYVQPTATAFPTATPGPTDTPTPRPTRVKPTAVPPAQPGSVLSAVVQPLNVDPQATLDATVRTSGAVTRIEVYLGSGVPGTSGPISTALTETATGTWSGSFGAPARPGYYHFTVGLFTGGRRTVIDNDNWNIRVLEPSSAAQPLPDNIPLVPPFNWGNPVAATFSADGRSVNGSEVSSTTRPDVTASYVSQWYANRLPASGWTIVPSTLPAQGATSFTIVANSGTQVCVVQYAAGTVHIFYG